MAKKKTSRKTARPLGVECRIVLLKGKEAFLRSAYTEQLRAAIEAAGSPVDVIRFDGATAQVADVLDDCRGMGLMGQHKLVVVDNAEDLVKEDRRPIFERYAQAPDDGATLVLRAETWRKGKLDAMIESCGVIQDCEPLSPARAVAAVKKRAGDPHGVSITPDAAQMLVDRVGTDLARLDSELAKLSQAAGDSREIDVPLVEQMVGLSREQKAWTIQDVLLSPSPEPALRLASELIHISRIDPVPIRWACIDLARKVHTVAQEVAQGASPQSAGRSLRLWGPSAQTIRSIAPRIGPRAAAQLLHEAVEADVRGKTGRGDPVRGLEMLIVRFASTVRAAVDRQ